MVHIHSLTCTMMTNIMITFNHIGLNEVWSGGQTGADEAGLEAARLNGIRTDGWAPYGFKTQRGTNLNLRDVYNLRETTSSDYSKRTEMNVKFTDGTI